MAALTLALAEVDSADATRAPRIPLELKTLIDAVLDRPKPASDKPALLFLLAYKMKDENWPLAQVPKGWRPADKILCGGLTERHLTLHDNVTAYGENMGIKGDASGFNLLNRPRLGEVLRYLEAHPAEVKSALRYVAHRFCASYNPGVEIQPLDGDELTYTRALCIANRLIFTESGGHFPQLLVAALLQALHEQWNTGRRVLTHHPHAADISDRTAGDIEELDSEGNVLDAYEVTVRPDWKNRRQDLLKKMAKFGLTRYTVICLIPETDSDLNSPAALDRYMTGLGHDIAVIDIRSFVAIALAGLTREARRLAFGYLEESVRDPKLCAIPSLIQTLKATIES